MSTVYAANNCVYIVGILATLLLGLIRREFPVITVLR